MDKQIDKWVNRKTNGQMDICIGRKYRLQIDKQKDRYKDTQIDRKMYNMKY